MDYHMKTCLECGYSLPMTWTDKKEMLTVLRGLGWFITPTEVYCPDCWRIRKWQYLKRSITVTSADSR